MNGLLTSFVPFGGDPLNASAEVMQALPDRIGALQLEKLCLPVSFRTAADTAIAAAEWLCPDAIVCLGQAGGRGSITPERVAINLMDAAVPDNDGFQPTDQPIIPDGPAAYFSTLPVKAMVRAMQDAGVPAAVSNTAGTYVCNSLLYALLHWAQGRGIPCGFVHLPYLTEQEKGGNLPALPKADAVRGVTAALRTLMTERSTPWKNM